MLTIDNKRFDDNYSIQIDYEINEYYPENDVDVEISGFVVPFCKINVKKNDYKHISIVPILIISTNNLDLQHTLQEKIFNVYDDQSGRIGFKRDYTFNCSFDDRLNINETDTANFYNCIIIGADEYSSDIIYKIKADYFDSGYGYREFIQKCGRYTVPKDLDCYSQNHQKLFDYIKIHK